jgi:hypothetical protein
LSYIWRISYGNIKTSPFVKDFGELHAPVHSLIRGGGVC